MDEGKESFERIGWFQVQLLIQLAFQSKYGYEIINDLKLNNINISTGQIYPALKKLEKQGALKTFTKRGRAARRKYYQITEKGLTDLRRIVQSMIINLIPIMYSFLGNLKISIFKKYKVESGDTVLLYSYPIKQALIDITRLVGDMGTVLFGVNSELIRQTLLDIAITYNFDKIIKPISLSKDFKFDCERGIADKAILLIFQREDKLNLLLDEVIKILKPNGTLYMLSSKLNIFDDTFLSHFNFFNFLEFFYGYTGDEIKRLCEKFELSVIRSENIEQVVIVEARKKD